MLFFGFVVISDLYLFQKTVLLNLCFIVYKQSDYWDKKFHVTYLKCYTVKLSSYFDNIQFFDHGKWSPMSQIIKVKSIDLQKLLKQQRWYCTGGCDGRSSSLSISSCSFFPVIFVLCLNDLPSEASASQISSLIIIPKIYWLSLYKIIYCHYRVIVTIF